MILELSKRNVLWESKSNQNPELVMCMGNTDTVFKTMENKKNLLRAWVKKSRVLSTELEM